MSGAAAGPTSSTPVAPSANASADTSRPTRSVRRAAAASATSSGGSGALRRRRWEVERKGERVGLLRQRRAGALQHVDPRPGPLAVREPQPRPRRLGDQLHTQVGDPRRPRRRTRPVRVAPVRVDVIHAAMR